MISLLDGLNEQIGQSIFSAITEGDEDYELDHEIALEKITDTLACVPELSDEDIRQILNDENPDNQVADISPDDECAQKIGDDSVDEDLKSLESMIADLLNM